MSKRERKQFSLAKSQLSTLNAGQRVRKAPGTLQEGQEGTLVNWNGFYWSIRLDSGAITFSAEKHLIVLINLADEATRKARV